MKVLYVAGSSRCGSTVLGNILGELDGFFNGGEIRLLWTRVLQGRLCGCQRPVDECPVWQSVLPSGGRDEDAIRSLHAIEHGPLRLYHATTLARRSRARLLRSADLARYVESMSRLYVGLANATGARVIIDSSKRPSNAATLRLMDGIEPYLLHLVRDARGVAHSQLRPTVNPDGDRMMAIVSPWMTAVDWTATNVAAEYVGRRWRGSARMFLRYEEFINDPRGTVGRIAAFIEEPVAPDPFIDEGMVELGPNHTVAGNPNRFQHGPVTLRPDIEWIDRMRTRDRRITTALSFPLLLRYGYPLRLMARDGFTRDGTSDGPHATG